MDRALGPNAASLGKGSLQIIQNAAGLVSGVGFENRSLTRLATFSGQFRSNLAVPVRAALKVTVSGSTWIGEAHVTNLTANTWQTANGLAPAYRWVEQGEGNGLDVLTVAGFRSKYGWGKTSGYLAAGD